MRGWETSVRVISEDESMTISSTSTAKWQDEKHQKPHQLTESELLIPLTSLELENLSEPVS